MNSAEAVAFRAAATAQVFTDDLEHAALDPSDEHHLFTVRRVRDEETVIIADGRGSWRACTVAQRTLVPTGDIIVDERPSPEIAVAFAPVKGDRSEWAVAKLTEVGCDRLVALRTERAVVQWNPARAEKALTRWRRVAREASAQCRRTWLPVIEGPATIAELEGDGFALAVPGGGSLDPSVHALGVGPEGGWSEAERSRGLPEVGLSDLVLRTETAAVAAGVLLQASRRGTVAAVSKRENRGRLQEDLR